MSIPGEILDGIDRLEPLPLTVQKLILVLDDEAVDFREVAQIIEYDGAITANVLRVANSAAFGGLCHIREIRDAAVRLGTVTLLDILLIGHLRALRIRAPQYGLTEDDLWLHGAAASLAAKAIVREARRARVPQVATVAALIHDIGKLIMVRYMKADVPSLFEICQEKNITLVEAERMILECDHAEVGGAMARKWSFPNPVTRAIELHHQPPQPEPDPVLDTVMLANEAAGLVRAELDPDEGDLNPMLTGLCGRLSLKPSAFSRICRNASVWLADLKKSYGIEG